MKTTKLVIGILSMVLFLVVTLQSCAAGIGNALSENGEVSGTAGFMTAIMLLAGGIVCVAGRKSKGGAIACVILYVLGGLIGITNAGTYSDLYIWSGLCFVIAVFNLISIFTQNFNETPPAPVVFQQSQYPQYQQPYQTQNQQPQYPQNSQNNQPPQQ